jgi:hypothetical protein
MPDRSAIDKAARLFCCLAAAAACLGGRADASDAAADFARHVAPFVQRHCVQCHGDTKQEGDVRLDGRPPDFQDAATRKTWERVWGVIASGQMPPQEVPAPGSDEMIPVLDWIREQAASAESLARRDGGGGNGVRRLTSREQVRVWKDLLDLHYANHQPDLLRFLAQDPRSEHFINRGNVLLMQNEHVQRSLDLAPRRADRAAGDDGSDGRDPARAHGDRLCRAQQQHGPGPVVVAAEHGGAVAGSHAHAQ